MKKRGPPIDRGWAWFVALGLFIKSLVNGGFIKSYGIFFSAFTDTYGRSASETQFVRSARAISVTLSGPFGTALSERYTERVIVIIGAFMMSIGFCLSFFAESLEFLIFTFGIFTGIGVAFINGPSRVCLGRYFDKKRGRANSLSLMGASVGQIAVPPLVSLLMSTYALRGTMLIYGGICLNVVICGALLRPLRSYDKATEEKSEPEATDDNNTITVHDTEPQSDITGSDKEKDHGALPSPNGTSETFSRSGLRPKGAVPELKVCSADSDRTRLRSMNSKPPVDNFTGSTRSITDRLRHLSTHLSAENIDDAVSIAEVKAASDQEPKRQKCAMCSPLVSFFKFIFDPQVIANPLYIIFLITSSLFMVASTNQITFIVPRAEEVGMSRDMAAILLSVVGGCDLFGRLLFGVLADLGWLSSHHLMALGVTMASAVMFALPFTATFTEMVVIAVLYGLIGSSHAILQLPVMVDFVGKKNLAKAVGMGIFFRGIFSSVVAPLLGLVKDKAGTFNTVFFVTASMQVVGSMLLVFFTPMARRRQQSRENALEITVETDKLNC